MTTNKPETIDLQLQPKVTAATPTRNDGKAFEQRFADLMRHRYGVRRTRSRVQVKGKVGARPHECDVHGMIYSPMWDILSYAGIAIGLLSLACLVQAWFPEEAARLATANVWLTRLATAIETRATLIHPSVAPYAVAFLGVGCTWLATIAKGQVQQHIWVECKDRKSTIKRRDITQLDVSVTNVRDQDSNADWRPDEVWFASTSDFDQDAIAFARKLRIRCLHVKQDGSVIELTNGR